MPNPYASYINLDAAWRVYDETLDAEVDLTPFFDHEGDSGRRLYAREAVVLVPFVPTKVPHGIAVTPREGHAFDIRSRSGSRMKKHIAVELGTVDAPYTGELCTVATYMPPLTLPNEGSVSKVVAHFETKYGEAKYSAIAELVEALGSLGVACYDPTPYVVQRGERISQLVELRIETRPGILWTDTLASTSRGTNGFNSTSEASA